MSDGMDRATRQVSLLLAQFCAKSRTNMNYLRRGVAALLCASMLCAPALANAAVVHVPEGTELSIRFNDSLSSGKNTDGDQFSITLDDDVKLADGNVLKAGYRGKGEVTHAKKKGMIGQAGEMNVRFDYIRVGETKLHIRGQKGGEGDGAMGATVALTLLFGPLGLLKHGHDVEIKSGQTITAYVDQDADVDVSTTPPPEG
jgi:hypothetical protein